MNLYFCTEDLHDSGLYVAAESRGKAKRLYCDYCDTFMDFMKALAVLKDFKEEK